MVPPPPSAHYYYPLPGYYHAWRGQQWDGSRFRLPPPPLPSHWRGLPQSHFRPQQQQPVTIVVHQHFHHHYGSPSLSPPRATLPQQQNLASREMVPVENNLPTNVDENIVIVNVSEEVVNLRQVGNPAVEENDETIVTNELDDVVDNNQVDNPAVAKRTQDDTGSNSIPRPGKRMKTTIGRVAYCNQGFTSLRSMANIDAREGQRVIARSRKWLEESNAFGEWTVHRIELDSEKSVSFPMTRGGTIEFFPQMISNVGVVRNEMETAAEYRQFQVRACSKEPRVHALYSTTKCTGYTYGRVSMGSNPLEYLPTISHVANQLANRFQLENCDWNIGCNLVVYRDGNDSINWHADDTQGEDVILSLTVDGSVTNPRTICFQPANTWPLKNGDEQIELYPIPGDVYSMDGFVQKGYVHAMLKTNTKMHGTDKRMAIIFRNGISKNVTDNGVAVESIVAPDRAIFYPFGNMSDIVEEGKCYSRDFLWKNDVFQNPCGSVDGCSEQGCPAIIVCDMKNDADEEFFHFLTYVVGKNSRHGALLTSMKRYLPIRVFRSSGGNQAKSANFATCPDPNKVVYRYDGIYYAIAVKDKLTFYLVRMEPRNVMEGLLAPNIIPALDFHSTSPPDDPGTFSKKTSEDIIGIGWDVNGFMAWNPIVESV